MESNVREEMKEVWWTYRAAKERRVWGGESKQQKGTEEEDDGGNSNKSVSAGGDVVEEDEEEQEQEGFVVGENWSIYDFGLLLLLSQEEMKVVVVWFGLDINTKCICYSGWEVLGSTGRDVTAMK